MNLQFISREATENLARTVTANLHKYQSCESRQLIDPKSFRISRIEAVEAPGLLDEAGNPIRDADAAKAVYQWLSHLTPVQASDERFWVYLTHLTYAEYVHSRWSRLQSAEKPEEFIYRRWFFRGEGVATFVQNAISRLWWFGYLTYDEKRGNPFELTDVLLSLQDIQVAFLERSLGRCRPLLIAVLETIIKYQNQLNETQGRGDIIQEWAKEIRLYGGAYILDVIPQDRLNFVVGRFLKDKISL